MRAMFAGLLFRLSTGTLVNLMVWGGVLASIEHIQSRSAMGDSFVMIVATICLIVLSVRLLTASPREKKGETSELRDAAHKARYVSYVAQPGLVLLIGFRIIPYPYPALVLLGMWIAAFVLDEPFIKQEMLETRKEYERKRTKGATS